MFTHDPLPEDHWDNTKADPLPSRGDLLRSYDAAEADLESQGISPRERETFGKIFDQCRKMVDP
jgi:hypothetical protein